MTASLIAPPAEAFFLSAETGSRFCLFHSPAGNAKGAVIYVPPFCEEMNNSRRMAALQSRALAGLGYGVLQMDLFGCGDSSGDFADARWDIWKNDLALARQWIEDRLRCPATLWGLRLGATLAMDYASGAACSIARLILWHPVINGETYLTQFLRMKLASEMLSGEGKTGHTQAIRDQLTAGTHVEVAGYSLATELADAISRLRLNNFASDSAPVHWFDLASKTGSSIPPAIARTVDAWKERDIQIHLHLYPGQAFWSAPEIGVSQALLDATSRLFSGEAD